MVLSKLLEFFNQNNSHSNTDCLPYYDDDSIKSYIESRIIDYCSVDGYDPSLFYAYFDSLPESLLHGTELTPPLFWFYPNKFKNFSSMLDSYVDAVFGDYLTLSSQKTPKFSMIPEFQNGSVPLEFSLIQEIFDAKRIEEIRFIDNDKTIAVTAIDEKKVCFYALDNGVYVHKYDVMTEGSPHGFDFSADQSIMYVAERDTNQVSSYCRSNNGIFENSKPIFRSPLKGSTSERWVNGVAVRQRDGLVAVCFNKSIAFVNRNKVTNIISLEAHANGTFDKVFFFGERLFVFSDDSTGPGDGRILILERGKSDSEFNVVKIKMIGGHGMALGKFHGVPLFGCAPEVDSRTFLYSIQDNNIAEKPDIIFGTDIPQHYTGLYQGTKGIAFGESRNVMAVASAFLGIKIFRVDITG